jgi:uncharacterized protein with GYD domain
MARYLVLFRFTDQGLQNVMNLGSRARAESRFKFLERSGIKIVGYYWVDGQYDIAAIVETEKNETAMSVLLRVDAEGFMRFEAMRAYTTDEVADMVEAMAPPPQSS